MAARATLTDIEALDNVVAGIESRIVIDITVLSRFGIYTLILRNTLNTFV